MPRGNDKSQSKQWHAQGMVGGLQCAVSVNLSDSLSVSPSRVSDILIAAEFMQKERQSPSERKVHTW